MSDDEDWREEVEYAISTMRIGSTIQFQIRQMEELSIAGSLSMLSEMRETTSEISGQRIWPGSFILAEYIHANPNLVAGKRTLELGAGTGIVSLVARLAGAQTAIATDGDLGVVTDILEWNIQHNAISSEGLGSINTTSLWWGDETSNHSFREKFGIEKFDTILAGDVLYKGELIPLLFATVQEWMKDANSIFFLCHIPRADVSHQVLQQALGHHGFTYIILQEGADSPHLPDDCSIDDVKKSKVYEIRTRQ